MRAKGSFFANDEVMLIPMDFIRVLDAVARLIEGDSKDDGDLPVLPTREQMLLSMKAEIIAKMRA
ncbi:MAG: hypothetical protein Kow0069_20920 [Promethearchaeota archaeon]